MMIIYKAEFPNGKVYIGRTKNFTQRKSQHIRSSGKEYSKHIIMSRAIKKYGSENIKWAILQECLDYEDMKKMEIYYIKLYNSTSHEFGYNMVCGDKESYKERENFDSEYKLNIILSKLVSNGHDPNKYVILTDDLKIKILYDYLENKLSVRGLAKKYKITKHRMTRILLSENIEIDKDRCKLTNTKNFDELYIEKVINLYNNGKLIKEIAKLENKTIMIISKILHNSGIRISKRFEKLI